MFADALPEAFRERKLVTHRETLNRDRSVPCHPKSQVKVIFPKVMVMPPINGKHEGLVGKPGFLDGKTDDETLGLARYGKSRGPPVTGKNGLTPFWAVTFEGKPLSKHGEARSQAWDLNY